MLLSCIASVIGTYNNVLKVITAGIWTHNPKIQKPTLTTHAATAPHYRSQHWSLASQTKAGKYKIWRADRSTSPNYTLSIKSSLFDSRCLRGSDNQRVHGNDAWFRCFNRLYSGNEIRGSLTWSVHTSGTLTLIFAKWNKIGYWHVNKMRWI